MNYAYTPAGRLQTIQRNNGVTSVYAYDKAGRLRSLNHTGVAGTLARYIYTSDAVGNRVRAEETIGGVTRVMTYTYDPLSRLIGAEYSTGEVYVYRYDAVGNRTAMTTTTGVTIYLYDAANRLTNVNDVVYTWDDRGNLISDGENTYIYDAAGRMRRAATAGGTLEYVYNADGLRVRQGADTFTWDWATGVPEVLRDGDSMYLVGHDTLGWQTGADWAYALPDALGSVRQETDADGDVTAAREWSPYGEELGEAQNGLGYTGEWFDAGVGLTYLRARWYDGASGRFTSQDAWEGDYYKPQTLHFYVYVENNAINLVDPSGLCPPSPPLPPGECLPPWTPPADQEFADRVRIDDDELPASGSDIYRRLSLYYRTEPKEWILARMMYSEVKTHLANSYDEMRYVGYIVKIRVGVFWENYSTTPGQHDGKIGPTGWHSQLLKNNQQFSGLWGSRARNPNISIFQRALEIASWVIDVPFEFIAEELCGYDSWLAYGTYPENVQNVLPDGKKSKVFHTGQNVFMDKSTEDNMVIQWCKEKTDENNSCKNYK